MCSSIINLIYFIVQMFKWSFCEENTRKNVTVHHRLNYLPQNCQYLIFICSIFWKVQKIHKSQWVQHYFYGCLSSSLTCFNGNKTKFEQKDSCTTCHWMIFVTVYVLTLLQMSAWEMLWDASKAHANCRWNHAKQIFKIKYDMLW